jgi:CHAT domain-containing protein/Tfp pilus assembly protein PilF
MNKILIVSSFLFFAALSLRAQSDELIGGIQQLMQKYTAGDYGEALKLSEKLLGLAEKEFGTKDPLYGLVLCIEAAAQAEMGNLEIAEKHYEASLAVLKNAPPDLASFVGRIYAGLGKIYSAKGELEKSEQFLLKSLPIYEKTMGRKQDYASTLNDLGNLYKDMGDFAKSEKNLKEGAEIRKSVLGEENSAYGVSLNNLASLYEQMGDYRNAAVMYEQSYQIWKKTLGEYHPLIATSLNNYAGLYVKVGSYDDAIKFYEAALIICDKVYGKKHERYIATVSNLGNVYRLTRNYEKAEEYHAYCLELRKEALGTEHIDYGYSLNNLGLVKMELGKYAEAEKYMNQALAIFKKKLGKRHKNVAVCNSNLGMVYFRMKDPAKAAPYLQQSLEISLERIDKVFPAISDKEKSLFFETVQANFEFFNYFTSRNYSTNAALPAAMYNYTIATKAILLNASNKIKRRILSSGDDITIQLYNEWRTKKDNLARVWQMTPEEIEKKRINESALEAEVKQIETMLSQKSQLFANQNTNTRYTWKDIQKKLKPDEAAVEIVRFRSFYLEMTDTAGYAALIIKPNSVNPEIVVLNNGNFLETKLISLYKNSIRLTIPDTKSYTYLWAPIAAKLQGVKKVFLSPDGVYNQVNVNSLYNPATKNFVMDELQVQQVTNTKDILSLPRRPELRNAVMVGFPDYKTLPNESGPPQDEPNQLVSDSSRRGMGSSIVSLPGTLTEVNKIANIFKSVNIETKTVIGVQANEAFVKKLQSPSILHIDTHGFFLGDVSKETENMRGGFMGQNPVKTKENPLLRSGILLAGAQKTYDGVRTDAEDGVLSAYEAMNLNLDETHIVVLSACETGLGEVRNGEGVYGFQRALIIAGAQSVIMSLWKVSDQVTQELMLEFYKFWVEGTPKRLAFIKAQNKIREQHPEPYYWAPFILIGD